MPRFTTVTWLPATENEAVEQVLEVLLGVSLATLCNFANNLAGSAINPELLPFAPGALES